MLDRTIVSNCAQFLDEIVCTAKYIGEEQLLTRLFLYGYDEENVDDALDEIHSRRVLLNRELRHLNKVASTFIESYGTNYNSCFRDSADFFFYIRRLLRKQLRVFENLRHPDRRSYLYCFGRSNSLKTDFDQPFLPFVDEEISKPKLRELANEIIGFSNDIFECISLCRKMMNEEMKIRQDFPRLRWVYEKTIAEICKNGQHLLSNFIVCPDSIDKIDDPMTREMLQTETDKWNEILAKYYHDRTPAQLLIHHMLLTAFQAKFGLEPTEQEKNVWGNDVNRVKKVQTMISCFDELNPKGHKDKDTGKYKLKGSWVAKLMHWAIRGTNADKKLFMDYFNETYNGVYQKIEYATVMAANLSQREKDECVIEFENFLNRKAQEEKQKIA